MWSHTPFLEYLVLVCTIAPAGLVRVAAGAAGAAPGRSADPVRIARFGVPAAYLVVTALALIVAAAAGFLPGYLTSWSGATIWPALGVAVGIGVLVAEIGAAALPRVVRGVRRIRVEVDPSFGSAGPAHLAAISATAAAEELLYRGLWIGILYQMVGLPAAVAIATSGLAYGLGHLYFGVREVVRKSLVGVVYGLLLVVSGDLLVPLVAHLTQNLAVFAIASRRPVPAVSDAGRATHQHGAGSPRGSSGEPAVSDAGRATHQHGATRQHGAGSPRGSSGEPA